VRLLDTMAGRKSEADEGSESSLTTVVSGGTLIFAGRVVGLGLGFLTQVVLARLLTQGAYGEVVLTLAVLNTVGTIAQLGLDDGAMRQFPQFEDDAGKARGVARAAIGIAIVSGSVAGIGVFVFAPVIATLVFDNMSLVSLIRIAAIGVPFVAIGAVSVGLARGARDARTRTYVDHLAKPILRLGFVAVLLLGGFGAVGAVAGEVGAYVLSGILGLVLVLRVLPSLGQPFVPMYRTVLMFSLPLIAVQALNTFVTQIDIYVLGYFWSSSTVGVYNIALQLSNLFFPILFSFSFLLPPILTRLHKQGKTNEMRRTYQSLTKWIVVLGMPLLLLMVFAPKLVIAVLFGADYTRGATALRILAIGNFFAISTGLTNASLIGLGENQLVALLVFYQTGVNAVLDLLLIPAYVTTGAALATALAVATNNAIGVVLLYQRFGVHPVKRATFVSVAVVGAIATVAFGVVSAVGLPPSFVVPIVGVLYPFVVVRVAVEPEDEELLVLLESRTNTDLTAVRRAVRAVK